MISLLVIRACVARTHSTLTQGALPYSRMTAPTALNAALKAAPPGVGRTAGARARLERGRGKTKSRAKRHLLPAVSPVLFAGVALESAWCRMIPFPVLRAHGVLVPVLLPRRLRSLERVLRISLGRPRGAPLLGGRSSMVRRSYPRRLTLGFSRAEPSDASSR